MSAAALWEKDPNALLPFQGDPQSTSASFSRLEASLYTRFSNTLPLDPGNTS